MISSNPGIRQIGVDCLIDDIERHGKDLWYFNVDLKLETLTSKQSTAEDKEYYIWYPLF